MGWCYGGMDPPLGSSATVLASYPGLQVCKKHLEFPFDMMIVRRSVADVQSLKFPVRASSGMSCVLARLPAPHILLNERAAAANLHSCLRCDSCVLAKTSARRLETSKVCRYKIIAGVFVQTICYSCSYACFPSEGLHMTWLHYMVRG